MSKISVNELSGAALDYAVALAEGLKPSVFVEPDYGQQREKDIHVGIVVSPSGHTHYDPSQDLLGNFGERLIDREGITTIRCDDDYGRDAKGFTTSERIPVWAATVGQHSAEEVYGAQGDNYGRAYALDVVDVVYGATRREAALRAYVWYKLGRKVKTVEIPKELA